MRHGREAAPERGRDCVAILEKALVKIDGTPGATDVTPSEARRSRWRDRRPMSFQVADIAASRRASVVFEDHDFPGVKTIHHVCVLGAEKDAWFKDNEGNCLGVHEAIVAT